MSDTETPIEAGARALRDGRHEAKKRGQDTWEFADMARVVFGSVGVEGLAEVLRAHIRLRPPYGDCSCGYEVPLGHPFSEHEAEAVIAWLGGGA